MIKTNTGAFLISLGMYKLTESNHDMYNFTINTENSRKFRLESQMVGAFPTGKFQNMVTLFTLANWLRYTL